MLQSKLTMNSILNQLNKDQQEAVTYTSGPILILAGAGSGKTRVLTHRAAYIIAKKIARPDNLLLLTFTNKAAGEMKDRVEKISGSKPFFTGTFHSFSARLLRIDGEKVGIGRNFVIYDTQDQKDLIKDIIKKLYISDKSVNPSSVLSSIDSAKNQMLSPLMYAEMAKTSWQEKTFKIYLEYEKALREANALDFNDLLIKAVDLLESNPETLNKWESRLTHVLVDEWQDTNKIQYKLTKLLISKNKNITAVGDASQSIYSWRGADFRNITNLIKDFPQIKIINLEQNYRSTENILLAANSIISKNTTHPILKLWTAKKGGAKIKIYSARSGQDEATFTVNEILKNNFDHKDVAVLYRTNAQSRVLEEAFLHTGVPYVLVGGVKFYERAEIKDILSYLRLLINPKAPVSAKRVEKVGKRRYETFRKYASEIENLPAQAGKTTLEILDKVVEITSYLAKFNTDIQEDYARLENIKELRSVATQFPQLTDFLENVALVQQEYLPDDPLNGQKNKNAVTLMTLHASKGLEFKTVFLIGMEEGLFPHAQSLWERDGMEEERRLAYVGITRAKEILYLTYASRRLYFGQTSSNPPSRFLIDIPEEIIETTNGYSPKRITEYNFDETENDYQ